MSTALIEIPQGEQRDVVCARLRVYQARTNQSLSQIGWKLGYAPRTIMRFALGEHYGKGDGHTIAQAVAGLMEREPATLPDLPGRLYESDTTRKIDELLAFCGKGGWGTLYGPAGAQKTFPLEYRAAQAARMPEPSMVLVQAEADMTPRELLGRIAQGVGCGYAQSKEALRQLLLAAIRRRSSNLVIAVDEADRLYRREDTIETLRGFCDALPDRRGNREQGTGNSGVGLLVAGNERVLKLFEPRKGVYFGGWRSRIGQKRVEAVYPTRQLAEEMLRGELGAIPQAAVDKAIEKAHSKDPVSGHEYIDLRFLKQQIEFLGEKKRKQEVAGRATA